MNSWAEREAKRPKLLTVEEFAEITKGKKSSCKSCVVTCQKGSHRWVRWEVAVYGDLTIASFYRQTRLTGFKRVLEVLGLPTEQKSDHHIFIRRLQGSQDVLGRYSARLAAA